jgi:hypothetical protein
MPEEFFNVRIGSWHKVKTCGTVEVYLDAFLNSTLDEAEFHVAVAENPGKRDSIPG